MKEKKLVVLLGSVFLLLAVLVMPLMVACAPAPVGPITLKAVTALPTYFEAFHGLGVFAERVDAGSQGQIKIDWVGGPEVIGPYAQAEAVHTGTIDMAGVWSISYESDLPEAAPMYLSEYTPSEERESGYYDWMVEKHKEKLNAYYLGRLQPYMPFYLCLNERVERPQDLSRLGLKIAVTEMWVPFMKALGLNPVIVEITDVYSAVERGVADGYVLPFGTSQPMGLSKVTKYFIDQMFFEANNCTLLVNLDKWKQIPKSSQDLMIDVMKKLEPEDRDHFIKYEAENQQKMVDSGVEPIKLSPEDAKWYRDLAYSSTWEDLKNKLSPESYDKCRKLLTK